MGLRESKRLGTAALGHSTPVTGLLYLFFFIFQEAIFSAELFLKYIKEKLYFVHELKLIYAYFCIKRMVLTHNGEVSGTTLLYSCLVSHKCDIKDLK